MLYVAFLLPLLVGASNVNIHHRVLVPQILETPFVQRGIVDSSLFQPSSSVSEHWLNFEKALEDLKTNPQGLDRALYQVALEREDAEWEVSSVKLCHLPFITAEYIVLHSSQVSSPYGIEYFVSPIPSDGSCPKLGTSAAFVSPFQAFNNLNTTIVHKSPTLPPLPQLRAPPPLTAEGAPVQPVPEKTFIQKYWMYGAAILVALLMTGGAPEEGQSRAGN